MEKRKKGERKMYKNLLVRSSEEFLEAIDELAWAKRQSKTTIMRLAFLKYFEDTADSLAKESRDKIRKLLQSAPEFQRGKKGKGKE